MTLVSRLLSVTLVCFRFVWEGLKVTPSPHQEHSVGLVMVAEGQMRHTTPYHTSPRPPMSTGGRHLRDTPPSALSYSQDGETGADGGAEEETRRIRWGFNNMHNVKGGRRQLLEKARDAKEAARWQRH